MTPDTIALFALPWGPVLIFLLRIVDVSLDTMRVLFAVKGQRLVAASLGFFQAFVWIFAVGHAIAHLDSIWHILGYAAGFATGTLVGVTIENKLAYGVTAVRIVSRYAGVEIADALRERGFGVTEFGGFGKEGRVEIINTVVQRQHMDDVLEVVATWDADAFITAEQPKVLRGGSIVPRTFWQVPWPRERGGRQRV